MELRRRTRVLKFREGFEHSLGMRYSKRPVHQPTSLTGRRPTVVYLRGGECSSGGKLDSNAMDTSCQDGDLFYMVRRNSSDSVFSKNADTDLTLLDNLEWIINFPIGSLFHCALDDDCPTGKNGRYFASQLAHRRTLKSVKAARGSYSKFPKEDGGRFKRPGNPLFCSSAGNSDSSACKIGSSLYRQPSRKPPLTYPQLIEKCLRENGGLTVHGIYRWLAERYTFFRSEDGKWKNAIRHNLSIRSQFRKGEARGRSHVWYLDNRYLEVVGDEGAAVLQQQDHRNAKVKVEGSSCRMAWQPRNELIPWDENQPPADVGQSPIMLQAVYRTTDTFEAPAQSETWFVPSSESIAKAHGCPFEVLSEVDVCNVPVLSEMKNFNFSSVYDDKMPHEGYRPSAFQVPCSYAEVPQYVDAAGVMDGDQHHHQNSGQLMMECEDLGPFDVGNELFLEELESFGMESGVLM